MITGIVTARPEVVFTLSVRDSTGQPHAIDAALDTGYTGHLTLPAAQIAAMRLPMKSQEPMMLADGTILQVDVYEAAVMWDGAARQVPVAAVETKPLIGMRLLLGHDLRVRVEPGGAAEIEAVP